MRLNGIRCDGCQKEHLFPPSLIVQSVHMELPDGWLMIAQGKYEREQEPFLFCSKACCHRWSGRELTANDIQSNEV